MKSRPALAIIGKKEFGHEEAVGDECHPRKGESWEIDRLQRTKCIAERDKQMEVYTSKLRLETVQVAEKAREEPEEWLLLESSTLLFVLVRNDQHDNGEDLREVMNLRLEIIRTGCISVILDDVHDEA